MVRSWGRGVVGSWAGGWRAIDRAMGRVVTSLDFTLGLTCTGKSMPERARLTTPVPSDAATFRGTSPTALTICSLVPSSLL